MDLAEGVREMMEGVARKLRKTPWFYGGLTGMSRYCKDLYFRAV